MNTMRWSTLVLSTLLVLGCGAEEDGREPVYPVSGTVTYQGGPLVGAAVSFSPTGDGPAAVGTTDENGKFQLTTFAKDDGAAVGSYGVAITKYAGVDANVDSSAIAAATKADELDPTDPNFDEYGAGYDEAAAADAPARENILPREYAHASTSNLTAEVTVDDAKNVFDFTIE